MNEFVQAILIFQTLVAILILGVAVAGVVDKRR
jgi:hypothetical protein